MCTDSPTADRDAIRVLPKVGANESPQEQPEEYPRVAEDKRVKTSTTDLIVPYSSSEEISVLQMKTETREKLSTPIVLSSTGEGRMRRTRQRMAQRIWTHKSESYRVKRKAR